MKELFVLVNEEIVPAGRAGLQVADMSIQRAYALFDFFKTLDDRPVFLKEHLDRFFRSAERMRLEIGLTEPELRERIDGLLKKNALSDSGVRLTLTGGYATDAYSIAHPNLVISQTPLVSTPGEQLPAAIRLVSYPHVRQMPDVKTIDYLMAIWLQPWVQAQEANDVLYQQNCVCSECPRSNIFMVTGSDELVTPSRNILQGVIRGKVLQLGRRLFPVEERDVTLDELYAAKEVFVTSTSKHIWPVVEVDRRKIGSGVAGPVAQVLNKELYRLVKEA